MAVTFIASAVSPTTAGAPAAAAVVPVPTGTLAGDLMLAFVSTNVQYTFEFPTCAGWKLEAVAASNAAWTAPVLYTDPFTPPNDPAGLAGDDAYQPIFVFSRTATGAEPADYTFSCAVFADGLTGAITTYRGVDPVAPFVNFGAGGKACGAGFNADGASATVSTGTIAALAASGTLIFCGANGYGGGPFVADGTLIARANEDHDGDPFGGAPGDSYLVQGVFDLAVTAAGASAQTATLYGRGNPSGWTNYQTSIWIVLAAVAVPLVLTPGDDGSPVSLDAVTTTGHVLTTPQLWVSFDGGEDWEPAVVEGEFDGRYVGASKVTVITLGLSYRLWRRSGWPDPSILYELRFAERDTVPGAETEGPTVSEPWPAGVWIPADEPLQVNFVRGTYAIVESSMAIWASLDPPAPNGARRWEAVVKGGELLYDYAAAGSTKVVNGTGWDFTLRRPGGWATGELVLRAAAWDIHGMIVGEVA